MNTSTHYYIGIDAHKRFSQVHVLADDGSTVWKGRIEDNDPTAFESLVHQLGGSCKAVFEASMNWHVLHDILSSIEGIEEVVMAHPLKVRIICDAQLKNDKVDAMRLAQLLRLDMVPRAHAASAEARHTKELVRQRACWVGMRTRIRNRTHRLLGGVSGGVDLPQCSDLFGRKGTCAMRGLSLPEPHRMQLDQNLETLVELQAKIAPLEKQLEARCRDNPDMKLLRTIPGLGKVLASVIGSEIDGIGRFATKAHFVGYCGLAPTTHGSAGKFNQGRMIAQCNRWLKWAFIEAAWVAIGCDGYFGSLFKCQRDRGKKANTAITIVARRIAQIAWEILSQHRAYRNDITTKPITGTKTFPARSSQGLVGEPA
jgi:transposase